MGAPTTTADARTSGERPLRDVAVVVLAAGVGRRLGEGDGKDPKWLTHVGGRPIAEHQLSGLELALDESCCAVVVGGHGVDRLQRWLERRPTPFPVDVCVNDDHVRRNNWYSLLIGLQWLSDRGWGGAAVVLNSDLCAEPGWFERFFRHVRAHPGDGGVLAVDLERPLTGEAMKVDVRRGAPGEVRCVRIGKTGVEQPSGEYVGMAGFGPGGWRRLLEALRSFCDRPELANAWYESAIQVLMDQEVVGVWPVPDTRWTEIDDQADLAAARRLMGGS